MSRKIIQDDRELLQMSEIELKKLQRQYRIMEGDKNSYATEIKCYLMKQRLKVIDTLLTEQNNLLNKISEEYSNSEETCSLWRKQFSDLLQTYEKYLLKLKKKKDVARRLDNEINKLIKKPSKFLQNNEEIKTTQMNKKIEKSSKQIHLLQNKLYNETVKYNEILAENVATRHSVDALLKNRARYNDFYKKMVMKLNSDRKKLLSLIEQATITCEQRNEADEKLKTTLNREQQETIAQKHKMTELHRQLDHLIHLREFINIKGQRRILIDLEEKENMKKLKKKDDVEKYLDKHTSILEQLKEFNNETNIDKLAGIFLKQEEENFALFNYVNEINTEVENLQDELKSFKISLQEQQKHNVATRTERSRSFESLCHDLDITKESVKKLEDELSLIIRNLHFMRDEIRIIFSTLKCSSPSFLLLLGDDQVSSINVNIFLDIIEKKISNFS